MAFADQFWVELFSEYLREGDPGKFESGSRSILQAADMHSARSLRQRCLDFILRHFDSVSKTSDSRIFIEK